jgi:hypothetical protein
MNSNSKLLLETLVSGVTLGALGDALLRAGPLGLNMTLWVLLVTTAIFGLALRHGIEWPRGTNLIIGLLVVFAAGFAWRANPVLKLLDLVALVVLATTWSLSLEGGRLRCLGLIDYVRGLLNSGAAAAVGATVLSKKDVRLAQAPSPVAVRRARAVALGLVMAFPLLFVFGGLLMAADAVFDRMVTTAFDVDFANLLSHAALAAFFAWIVIGFSSLVLKLNRPLLSSLNIEKPGLGTLEIAVPLILLNLLFLVFVVVQLRYLFGDASLVQVTVDLTYSEYARRGFFELVTVTALALPLLLVADWVLAGGDRRSVRTFRILGGVFLVLLFVIMASAVKRMLLYQTAYGLTDERLYATAFMVWIGIVLTWFAATVLRGRREAFATGAAAAGLLVILSLNVLNPDALIMKVNLERALAGEGFDAAYATSLSGDMVPVLVPALSSLDADDRCALATHILEHWSPPAETDWRSWNHGRSKAWGIVRQETDRLEAMRCDPPTESQILLN